MSWTDPTTRSTGDLITAAIWNTDLVDNLLHLRGGLPSARVYNNANISVASGTETALTFNSERYDTDGIHDTSQNTGRLTCKTAGKYLIWGSIEWGGGLATGSRLSLRLNGTAVIASENPYQAYRNNVAAVYDLAVNDYLELVAYQSTGSAMNVLASGNYSPEFGMHRIG